MQAAAIVFSVYMMATGVTVLIVRCERDDHESFANRHAACSAFSLTMGKRKEEGER